MALSFNLDDKEIEQWLLSRDWLFFYGKSRPNSGIFYPVDKQYLESCSKCAVTGYPYYHPEHTKNVYLQNARSNCYTWAFPTVVLSIYGDEKDVQDDKYELSIYFCYGRGETEYEQVFNGFIKDFNEFLFVLRAVGIHENYITGCQKTEC